jgi:ribosomal protein S18 acetylase RimI-like enzyme
MTKHFTVRLLRLADLDRILEIEHASFGKDAYDRNLFAHFFDNCGDLFLVATRGALSQVRQQQPLLEMCDVIEFRSLVSSQLRAILAQHCASRQRMRGARTAHPASADLWVERTSTNRKPPSKMIRSRSLIALSKSARLGDLAASESFVASADRS